MLSLSPAFRQVAVVQTSPPPGSYELVLVPKITEVDPAFSRLDAGLLNPRWQFSVTLAGTLAVLDQAGKQLRAFPADATGVSPPPFARDRSVQAAASEAVTQLIQKWSQQLVASREVEELAGRNRPILVQGSGSSEISLTVSYPTDGARVTDDMLALVGIASAPKGIQRVELLVNGRPVPVARGARAQSGDIQSHPFTADVPLRVGTNVIALTAADATGAAVQTIRTVHRGVGATATQTALAPKAGERWAVVIGIDRYQDPAISALKYAGADAQAIFAFLTTRGGVKPNNARLLLNQQATQRNVRQVLGDFLRQKSLPDDEIIIYYAGHGTTEPDAGSDGGISKYLVPWDADPNSLFSTAIPMDEIDRIFGRLSARKILLIQDTCFSGGAGGRTFLAKGLTIRSATLTDKFLQELTQKEGRMILTASDVNQVSHEDPTIGHGIFTHYFLQALESGAADLDVDGAITVREVHLYLQRKVHEHSRGAQTPQLYNIGDMVLIQKSR